MATVRIRLVTSRDIVSDVIRAAQLGFTFTHAEAEVPGGYLGAHASGGVAIRPVGYDAGPGMQERFYALEATPEQADAFQAFLAAQCGKPYDFAAIADFVAAAVGHSEGLQAENAWRDPARWFCSELMAAALIVADIFPAALAAGARHVTPQNLAFALSGHGSATALLPEK
jgi:hypothetical protein